MNVYSLFEGMFVRVDRDKVYKVVNGQPVYQSSLTTEQWTGGNVAPSGNRHAVVELTKQEMSDKGLVDFNWSKYAGKLVRINTDKVYRVSKDGLSARYQLELTDAEWDQVEKGSDVGSMTLKQKLFSDEGAEAILGEKVVKTGTKIGLAFGSVLVASGITGLIADKVKTAKDKKASDQAKAQQDVAAVLKQDEMLAKADAEFANEAGGTLAEVASQVQNSGSVLDSVSDVLSSVGKSSAGSSGISQASVPGSGGDSPGMMLMGIAILVIAFLFGGRPR